jgi:glycosyltransferase involved in cell wall biosynthesis
MRIALIAPPFIPVPPVRYGGTELFIGQLAKGLKARGVDVVVYSNGEATVPVERRWLYPQSQWPIQGEVYDNLKDQNHTSWAVHDAAAECDVIHVNNVPGLMFSRFLPQPFVYTMHHPHLDVLSAFFAYFPEIEYVTISDFQRHQEKMPRIRTIHHGLDFARYRCCEQKRDYLAFIGRIAPVKGPHLAIEIAKRAGMPLKLAGEVQPLFREYFEREIKPHLDGKNVEFIGEVDLAAKNDFLGHARALLFPIQWDEPFGLVMIEAMACGAPVLALSRGSVPEIVQGPSGAVCGSIDEMVELVRDLDPDPAAVRAYAEERFSIERMAAEYHALYEELLHKRGQTLGEEGELPAGQAVA